MNELQIRLTADIQGLQSAINKAKQTLKSFESETATDSEKSNVGFRRKIGLIEQLNAKAKQLKVSLAQATNEQQIASFNAELEQTNIELARLNALGKSFANTSVQSFDRFRVSAGAANGSAIAFNRIIQDAPFGIIGVANNIQQFAEQLSALRVTTGSTGSALSTFFGSLVTKSNLLILAISAVTAAFTAYQLGLFDSKKEVDELTKAQEEFNESLKDTNALLAKDLLSKLLKDVGLLKTENIGGRLIDVPAFETAGQVVDALSGKINRLRKGELELLERFLTEQISTATRDFANSNSDLEKSLATEEIGLYKGILEKVNQQLKFYKETSDEAKESAEGLNRVFDDQVLILERFGTASEDAKKKLESLAGVNLDSLAKEQKSLFEKIATLKSEGPLNLIDAIQLALAEKRLSEIDQIIGSIASKRTETDVPIPTETEAGLSSGTKPIGIIEGLQQKISDLERLREVTSDPTQLAKYTEQIANLRSQLQELTNTKDQTTETINAIVDAFSSLGAGIAASLNIGDRALRGFVTTLLSATPKIIGALIDQASAKRATSGQNIASDKAEALAGGVGLAVDSAKGLGPVGLAVLPVLIAGAVALISSAFGKSSGGGSVSAGTGSTFTNRREFGGPVSKGRAYIVGERRPELFVPNTNGIILPQLPSMDYSGASMSASNYGVDIRLKGPDDLLFFVEQAQIRRGLR